MRLLRSVFPSNVLTWFWSASKQTAEQFAGVSPLQKHLPASWCVSGTENRVSVLDEFSGIFFSVAFFFLLLQTPGPHPVFMYKRIPRNKVTKEAAFPHVVNV